MRKTVVNEETPATTTPIGNHVVVTIYDMQPPAWISTREANIAWLTCRWWRLRAMDATVGTPNYQDYREQLLKQAWQMYRFSIAEMPTERLPIATKPLALPSHTTGQGLLSAMRERETIEMEAVSL
jgi:hypothetical protein